MPALGELAEAFCKRPEIGPKTRQTYRDHLDRFFAWARECGLSSPEDLTPDAIDQYAHHLEGVTSRTGKPLAVASRRAYLKGVQQFLSWLEKRHGIGVNSRLVPVPGVRRQHRDVLSRDEIQRLEDAARIERDKLMIRLMADTGVRLGEVASVRLDDLIMRDRYTAVRVRGKTGERVAPVTPALYRRLAAYADGKTGRPRTRSPYLFMAHRRRPGHQEFEPLTEEGVYQAIKDAVERAELGRRVHPHLLRHSAITYLLVERRMDALMVSDICGVSLSVIQSHYRHPTDQQRYEAVMRAMGERA